MYAIVTKMVVYLFNDRLSQYFNILEPEIKTQFFNAETWIFKLSLRIAF